MPFNLEGFITDCRSAIEGDNPQELISDIVENAIRDPNSVFVALGTPERSMVEKLYVSNELTIINVVWAPKMTMLPHNHNTWAVVGVYAGREDNIFWRRLKDDPNGKIEAAGAKSIASTEVAALGKKLIHSVTNPTSSFTSAIHVYGANFFEIERSEWEPVNLVESPYDVEKNVGLFEVENTILKLRGEQST